MTRKEAIALLSEFRGPLGPFQEPADLDLRQEAWASLAGVGEIDAMLDLAVHPPEQSELGQNTPADFEYEISRALSLLGARHPEALLNRAGPLIDDPTARRTIIEVIGAVGVREGLFWLAPLVGSTRLSEEDATRLACAIGEIGGPNAEGLLKRLQAQTPAEHGRVLDEIENAMQYLRAR